MCERILCIIPARGGSKRILRKNIRPFEGRPVIDYSIRAALDSGIFDEVMVSTDDLDIADVARDCGASVPFMRSKETSDDYATTADVIREVLHHYEERGRKFDAFCCLYATAPFVTPERLRQGAEMIAGGDCPAAFTCVQYSYPIQRCLVKDSDGCIAMMFPQYAKVRSQDLQPTYHDAGQFYFCTVRAFESCGSLWAPGARPIVLPETEVQDLDTPLDWALAEMKYRMLSVPGRIRVGNYEIVPYQELDFTTSELMRRGRNASDVASQMVNSHEITIEEHRDFVRSLAGRRDKGVYALIGGNGIPVGCVNITRTGTRRAERGIWLFEEARGKGHAKTFLEEFYPLLAQRHGIDLIETRVKEDNLASNALERSLGAEETEHMEGYIFYVKSI